MSSWAGILKSAAPPVVAAVAEVLRDDARVAVIDANAIINGVNIAAFATTAVTIPEVLAEVRDERSRAWLAALPFALETREPCEESLKAVLRFARETGDIHALSSVDMRLLALAHMLEVAVHGRDHLREHPVQPTVKGKGANRRRQLPGWGKVDNPADWKEVDEAPDAAGQGKSRIRTGGAIEGDDAAQAAGAGGGGEQQAAGSVSSLPAPASASTSASTGQQQAEEGAAASSHAGAAVDAAAGAVAALHLGGAAGGAGAGAGDEEEDDDWAVAGKSRNSERRRTRKQSRWEERQEAAAGTAGDAPKLREDFAAVASQPATADVNAVLEAARAAEAEAAAAGEGGGGDEAAGGGDDGASDKTGGSGSEDESDDGDEGSDVELEEVEEGEGEGEGGDADGTEGGKGGADASVSAADPVAATTIDGLVVNTTSSIMSVTADYAMQNVLLQMGLRLVSRDGRAISRLSRYVLRCHACFHVTKDSAQRVFCPRCGNMAMERVEVVVGPDGTEFYGVKKKYCLKGTRFSLPKPKSGRAGSANPILSEDVMMMRMGKKLRRAARKAGQEATEEGGGDTFGPEHGTEAWFRNQAAIAGGKGTAYMLTSWKNNPNERKHQASNRRG
ncbi:hypothetical protein FOA52_006793 [Chlamydomonas sp. UWO 241]|nr:hypothetical protein FOA52_006793 [Chlamydomonas sp. UWO 241]